MEGGSVAEFQKTLGCHPVIARILWNRGFRAKEEVERFLKPELIHLPDPFGIIDMRRAVDRIAAAVEAGEKIAVYGDYDVDGTCGSALLVEFFRQSGVEVLAFQPNRFTDGYGVHSSAVERLIGEGARCIITVDCGITAVEPARLAQGRGVDMIILDHHKVGAELPAALAVVNPQRAEDTSGLKNLCGAGIAFFFARGLRGALRSGGYYERRGIKEPNLLRLLDLVAVATVADVVDLRGVNRILVKYGLSVMANTPRPGIQALLEAAGIKVPSAMHCGFVLGPRINAAGRLESARAALGLLTCQDLEVARGYAQDLERLNSERRKTQDRVLAQAREAARRQLEDPKWKAFAAEAPAALAGPWPRALVLEDLENAHGTPERDRKSNDSSSLAWHEGVVGIVASKIAEEFGRPAFILASTEQGFKGSVRSQGKIDVLAAISAESVATHLTNFGGHAHAGGVSLKRENLLAFDRALNLHMAVTLAEEHYRRERRFDAEVQLGEIDATLVEELEWLEPFGHGFPEPVLKLRGAPVSRVFVMKEKHLKLKLGRGVDAVWFNAVTDEGAKIELGRLEQGHPCELWVSPQWNEWQGSKRLQLRVSHGELIEA